MKPCRCPCGLAVELRAVAAPGCFHSVCDHCTAACNAAARMRLELACAELSGRSTSPAATAFAALAETRDAYVVRVPIPQT
ncbi:hypothetical protein M5E06_10430 [Azospirillum sp. A1-3]|uniref:hypothetical protein n=1 Tax=Azospirillum sp. A1-3 TaxID=185874 RepID=UPI002076EC50|nr:hypothetical protein [Azospirillum sp. A1-3]MCM8734610.1 hypothetical protein [Azospirillum sp. A1-3]